MGSTVEVLTILLLLCYIPINSLTIHTANQQYNLPSHYTTLGSHQLQQYKYNFTLIYAHNNTDTCHFQHITTSNNSLLVIYGSLPNTPSCTTDVYSKHTAMARLAQASGFAGVVTQSEEKFYDGRIVGFDSTISIPYLVVSSKSLHFIVANVSMITEIELPIVTTQDARNLKAICIIYIAWRATGGILYGSQIFIIGYSLWVERFLLRKTRKVLWQSVSLKVLAFIVALFSFLWVTVDPFGFLGLSFPSAMFVGMVVGCFFCIFMFLLQIWTLSLGNFGFMNCRVVSIIIYSLSAIMMLITLFQGMLWYNTPLRYATFSVMFTILALCGVGFFLTGRRMISIMRNSNNTSVDQRTAKKIAHFVMFFLSLNSCALILYLSSCLGKVVSLMVVHIICGIIILCTFVILFLPVVLKQQHLLTVESNASVEHSNLENAPPVTVKV